MNCEPHDPLRPVELLLNNGLGDLSPDQMEAMRVVKKASQRLERLIEDLILFTTSEANKLVLEKTQFNIQPSHHRRRRTFG